MVRNTESCNPSTPFLHSLHHSCCTGNILELLASIVGPEESPYAAGTFQLSLKIPENYPFEPPKAQFITPIYHPNIDSEGRVRLTFCTLSCPIFEV